MLPSIVRENLLIKPFQFKDCQTLTFINFIVKIFKIEHHEIKDLIGVIYFKSSRVFMPERF